MPSIAIASTIENIIIATSDNYILLKEIFEFNFDIIVKEYNLSDDNFNLLSYPCRLKFNNIRDVIVEKITQFSQKDQELIHIYQYRKFLFDSTIGRYEHALRSKYRSLLTEQSRIYDAKFFEAEHIISFNDSPYRKNGFVKDYSEELSIEISVAANMIITKHNNEKEHLKKLERLRIRHFSAIKRIQSKYDYQTVKDQIDKDFLLNMLL